MAKDAFWYDWVTFRLAFGPVRVKILGQNIPLPFVVFTGDFTSNPCSINGGRNSIDPFHIEVKAVNINDAFKFNKNPDYFSGEKTDKLDLSRHRAGKFNNSIIDYKDPLDEQALLPSTYISLEGDGVCAYLIPCNRRKVATDPEGNLVEVDDSQEGLYTEFDGAIIARMLGEVDRPNTKVLTDRVFMKIPQWGNYDDSPEDWVSRKHTFKANRLYSIVQKWFSANGNDDDYSNVGMVANLLDKDDDGVANADFADYKLDYPLQTEYFKNRNVHFCLYFLQYGYKSKTKRINQSTITCEEIVGKDNIRFNSNPIGGGLINTQHLAKGANFMTNFLEIPKKDIIELLNNCKRSDYSQRLVGKYYTPTGNLDTAPTNTLNNTLFFKGLKEADCFRFLYENNLL
jgi:hypothetical protein